MSPWIRATRRALSGLAVSILLTACNTEESGGVPHTMDVIVPLLSPKALSGQKVYLESCASCHGPSTGGTHQGPPLVMYDEAHHPDGRFYDAVQKGVKQHHWSYGDMPPIPGITQSEIALIIAYVREIQAAEDRRHRDDTE